MAAPLASDAVTVLRCISRNKQLTVNKIGLFGSGTMHCLLRTRPQTARVCLSRIFSSSSQAAPIKGWSVVKAAGTLVGLGGAGVFLWSRQRENPLSADVNGRPYFKPARTIKSETDNTGLKLTLYQYQSCPFCCKVRAYLDYYGFSYDVIEVNSVWRTQIKWSKYRKVPVLVADGISQDGYLQMNDSSVIVSALQSFMIDRNVGLDKVMSYFPALEEKKGRKTVFEFPNRYFLMYGETKPKNTPAERKEEREWRFWADDVMVHMLSPNVYRTPAEAVQAFKHFSDVGDWENNFSNFERLTVIYLGASVMYILGKMLKRKYKLKDDVRESLYDAANEWTKAIGKGRQFMGGDKPNLADLAVYGVLSSIEDCDAFNDMLKNTKIKSWYYRCKADVTQHKGSHPLNSVQH